MSISVDETEESLVEKIKKVEHITFPRALKLLATNQVYLDKEVNKVKWVSNSSDVFRNIIWITLKKKKIHMYSIL